MRLVRVVAALVLHEGRILIARRAAGERLSGYWEFPGGKVRSGESDEAALRREIAEELGLHIRVGNWFTSTENSDTGQPFELVFYWSETRSSRVYPTVHDQIRWVTPDMLGEFRFLPADEPVVRQLQAIGAIDKGNT
jgi:8-oxo-dGTP diphosphatase